MYSINEKIVLGGLITALFAIGLLSNSVNSRKPDIFARERGFFLIDINKAGMEELKILPYVSERIANEIVRYRQEKGTIKSTDELLAIKGIGHSKIKGIRKYLKP